MKLTRRKFIQSSAVAALATTLGHAAGGSDAGLVSLSSKQGSERLSYLMREHFLPFINTSIRITSPDGRSATVVLREAADTKDEIDSARGLPGECFRLGFDVPRKARLDQGIYDFDHESLGQFSLFLAPTGGSGAHYEAIINRVC